MPLGVHAGNGSVPIFLFSRKSWIKICASLYRKKAYRYGFVKAMEQKTREGIKRAGKK